ncbi:hypothetical protein HUT06_18735 [Actinomadura sp. NAK00032]|uniref:hypothetical protein n=1 Tax=Actinomadura sp. NAK00032 TaxID=2742128 RepID=UPI001591D9F1|nr:hypothetical protein [Actinomadura sp. NAK00032]QKW35821.1 hypothetical protein HUT06_18735 [Actinomadura sp. NAK00032]
MTRGARPLDPPSFLRLDPPELDGGDLVVRARPTASRARTRTSPSAPLAYLYEAPDEHEPEHTTRLAAGHYDTTTLTWSFSGDIPGIIGLTEPTSP